MSDETLTAGIDNCRATALEAPLPQKAPKNRLTRRQRRELVRILAIVAALALVLLLPVVDPAKTVLLVLIYIAVGWDIIWRAVRNIAHGQVFDENFLMAVATVGALLLGDTLEAITVMLFYRVGEWFEAYAVGRSRNSIAALMDIRPDYANRQLPDGTLEAVAPEAIAVGELIVVKPGERVPLDGCVAEGASSLDTSALTGESAPRDVQPGAEVISGCINLTGVLIVKVSRPYSESTVVRILDLVENASSKKAKAESFITRFARYYTPAVCFAALALAVLPPLFTGQAFGPWVYRALTFLVISCPCALVISVPLSFFGGIGGASRTGVLIKGSNYLEALAKADTVVFDKTGTLTEGRFALRDMHPVGMEEQMLLEVAAYAEEYSNHPIAQSVRAAYGQPIDPARVAGAEEQAGYGVRATIDGRQVLCGNANMMRAAGVAPLVPETPGTAVHLAIDGVYAGYLLAADVMKPDAKAAVAALRKEGIRHTAMLTGDSDAVGRQVAGELGLDDVYTQLLPTDKVEKVEALLAQSEGKLVYVGDGVNDAPVLARADIGIAMGGLGSDAAIEAADIVVMTDEPSKIAVAMRISRKTLAIVKQNIVFALGVKAVVLGLGAIGFASLWAAVFADVGVSVIAILNAMRAMRMAKEA